jgi:hypothetical protein
MHRNKITSDTIKEIQEKHTACAIDYKEQLHFLEKEYEKENK